MTSTSVSNQSLTDIAAELEKLQKSVSGYLKQPAPAFGDSADLRGRQIVLPSDECPAEFVACDAWDMARRGGSCPPEDQAPHPPMYTRRGDRCYTKQSVKRSREDLRGKSGRLTAMQNIRSLVLAAAKLNAKLAAIGQAEMSCSDVDTQFNNGTEEEKKDRRRAFCGTLMSPDGKAPRCQTNASDMCEDVAGGGGPAAATAPAGTTAGAGLSNASTTPFETVRSGAADSSASASATSAGASAPGDVF
jgi:hypothetical protein